MPQLKRIIETALYVDAPDRAKAFYAQHLNGLITQRATQGRPFQSVFKVRDGIRRIQPESSEAPLAAQYARRSGNP